MHRMLLLLLVCNSSVAWRQLAEQIIEALRTRAPAAIGLQVFMFTAEQNNVSVHAPARVCVRAYVCLCDTAL